MTRYWEVKIEFGKGDPEFWIILTGLEADGAAWVDEDDKAKTVTVVVRAGRDGAVPAQLARYQQHFTEIDAADFAAKVIVQADSGEER